MKHDSEAQARRRKLIWIGAVNVSIWILCVLIDPFVGPMIGTVLFLLVLLILAISVAVGLKAFRGDHW